MRDELEIYEHEDETVADLDQRAMDLFSGSMIESEEEYWEEKIATGQMGFEEAVRVFLTTRLDFYPYNPETVGSTVTESIGGYDTYFGPRTMEVLGGILDTTSVTDSDRLYEDNWNIYGGSGDPHGEYWRRMLREYGSWPHPETGEPFEVNTFWSEGREEDPYDRQGNVEMDYHYENDELIENITIPGDAVDYIPEEDKWMDVGDLVTNDYIDDDKAAVAATIDVHTLHEWHDGSDFSLQDMMFHYAREKELGCEEEEPYHGDTDDLKSPWWDSIHAIEWNEENGTYTVYGDYTFPMEDKIGDHYSFFPETNPLTYYGFDQMHATDEYDYDPYVADEWIHQLDEDHAQDMVTELQAIDEVPAMLSEDADAPIPMDFAEWEDRVTLVSDFVDVYGHAFISTGPFVLEHYDGQSMTLERWNQYGYPYPGEEVNGVVFEEGYWREQFVIEEHDLEVDVEGQGETIPEKGIRTYQDGTEVVVEAIPDEYWGFSHWEGNVPEEKSEEEMIIITMDDDKEIEANFRELEEYELTINAEEGGTTDPEPDTYTYYEGTEVTVEAIPDDDWFFDSWTGDVTGEDEEITFTIESDMEITATFTEEVPEYELTVNIDGDGEVDIDPDQDTYEAGTEVTLTATPDDGWEFDEWTGDATGTDTTITITMDEDKSITAVFVEEDPEEDPDDTPGFTLALLVLGAVIAVAIYYKKEQ